MFPHKSGAGVLLACVIATLAPQAYGDPVTTSAGPVSATVQVPSVQDAPVVGTDTCTSFTGQKHHASFPFNSPDPLNPALQWTFNTDIYVSRTCPGDAVITKIVAYESNVLSPDWVYYGVPSSTANASTAEATGDFGYYPSWAPQPPAGAPNAVGYDLGCDNINVIIEPRANYCRAHLYPQILWSIDTAGNASYVTQWG